MKDLLKLLAFTGTLLLTQGAHSSNDRTSALRAEQAPTTDNRRSQKRRTPLASQTNLSAIDQGALAARAMKVYLQTQEGQAHLAKVAKEEAEERRKKNRLIQDILDTLNGDYDSDNLDPESPTLEQELEAIDTESKMRNLLTRHRCSLEIRGTRVLLHLYKGPNDRRPELLRIEPYVDPSELNGLPRPVTETLQAFLVQTGPLSDHPSFYPHDTPQSQIDADEAREEQNEDLFEAFQCSFQQNPMGGIYFQCHFDRVYKIPLRLRKPIYPEGF